MIRRREVITLLGGAAGVATCWRARSSPNRCGASVCWLTSPKMIQR